MLTLAVAPISDRDGVTLERTGATLTAAAAKTIARRLQVAKLPRTSFATVAATASFAAATAPPAPPGDAGPAARPPRAARRPRPAPASRR